MDINILFFYLLECSLNQKMPQSAFFKEMTEHDWKDLYRLCKVQGLTAVAFDVLSEAIENKVLLSKPPREVVLQWYSNTMQIEKRMEIICSRSEEFAQKLDAKGIRTWVLKGIAVSRFYPNPLHREFGDLDCLLQEKEPGAHVWKSAYEKGNLAAEEIGALVKKEHYKHSHIIYRSLTIENHQFCLPVRGSKITKELERCLCQIVYEHKSGICRENDSYLLCPPADFNAIFLVAHAMIHFLSEGIKMRHVLDWAMFLKTEYQQVDWNMFWSWCEKMHYVRFVECLNWICEKKLGLNNEILLVVGRKSGHFDVEKWANKMLNDIFYSDSIFNKGYSPMLARMILAKNFIQSAWKYHYIAEVNPIMSLLKQASAIFWDRTPSIIFPIKSNEK